jgi:hypothetical protein
MSRASSAGGPSTRLPTAPSCSCRGWRNGATRDQGGNPDRRSL